MVDTLAKRPAHLEIQRKVRHLATHWPSCKAEAPVYSLRDKLADK